MLFFRKKSVRTQSIFPYFCLLYATSFAVIFSTYQNICSAMTVDEFVYFLANPPLHGHVQITQITPIHSKEAGVTNRLVQTYDYLWSGQNIFSTVQEGKYKKQSGIFRTVEWDHLDGNLTKYAGINKNDAMRHRSPLNANIANLKALGIYYFVQGSVRWNDGFLDAEVDMPGAREKTNIMPHLKGRFITLPDGTVKRLEYAVYIPGHEQEGSVNYSIDYRFDGKWGAGFPSYVAVYLSGETNHIASVEEQELFYESEIEEWDINQTPSEEKMNPDLNFNKSEQYVISNNVAYFLEKNFTGDKGKFQRIESSADLSAKSVKQTQVKNIIRCIILAAIILPLVIWGWLAAKQNKQNKQNNR